MSKINEKKTDDLQSKKFESAFSSVPESQKKSLLSLTFVLAGYPIALSNFVMGGQVGAGMTFANAMLTIIVSNAFLIGIVLATGILAFKTGLSTSFLSRRTFGKSGSNIFSLLLAGSAVTWISLNGDIFARLVISTFSWWFLPVSITAVLSIALWTLSAIRGYDGLEVISFIGVPAALIMSIGGIIAVGMTPEGYQGVMDYVPAAEMTFSTGTASIIGGWIFGATISPDVCRFAKKKLHVYIAGIVAFVVGCLGLQVGGALVAISTGYADFTVAMGALGLSLLAFLAAIFCLWTTQDNNIYGASLALQNIFEKTKLKGKVKHSHIALGIAILAAILAASGVYNHILPIVSFLSILIPPVPGLIIAQEYFIKKSHSEKTVNPLAIISWIIAGIASYISLKANWFVPPMVGVIVGMVSYIVLSAVFIKSGDKQNTEIDSKE